MDIIHAPARLSGRVRQGGPDGPAPAHRHCARVAGSRRPRR